MYTPKYFSEGECALCIPSFSVDQIESQLWRLLDELREKCDFALPISSGYRSPYWDLAKGRSGRGAHTKGLAVDIKINNSYHMRVVLSNALTMGFKGIGVGKSFIHLDIMDRQYSPLIWGY